MLGVAAVAGCAIAGSRAPVDAGGGTGGSGISGSGGKTGEDSGADAGSGSGGAGVAGNGGADVSGSGGGDSGMGGQGGVGSGGMGSGGAGSGGAGGASGTGGMVVVGPTLPLPLVVTSNFDNQGWFGDAAVSMDFKPGSTVITQAASATGPCANRIGGAKGQCLKIVYTPPTDVTLIANGFVGVFFLTTLKLPHPEQTPPVNMGQANWGPEPGVHIAAGATKISFVVAADTAGQSVDFKAGAAPDTFLATVMTVPVNTTWESHALSVQGQDYGNSVIGGFAWALTNTANPVTFYLDNIVWE